MGDKAAVCVYCICRIHILSPEQHDNTSRHCVPIVLIVAPTMPQYDRQDVLILYYTIVALWDVGVGMG